MYHRACASDTHCHRRLRHVGGSAAGGLRVPESHELRTPLAAIKGSTTTVLGASRLVAPAETRQFFRIIDEQADRMNGLLVDLLDAGRIDAGTLSVSPES